MSEFSLEDLGEGRFALSGAMSFGTAQQLLRASERLFDQHQDLQIDLSGVQRADSAGLALVIEWTARARQRKARIQFTAIPKSLLAVARTSEVEEFIPQ